LRRRGCRRHCIRIEPDGLIEILNGTVELVLLNVGSAVPRLFTDEYDVPLMVSRGYASLSFLHSAAESMSEKGRPCHVYHFGDYDPSGVNAAEKIHQTLRQLAPDADIHFKRCAVTPEQIWESNLPSRPTKVSDSRTKTWTGGESVEFDAFTPDDLRSLVRYYIEQHLPPNRLEILQAAEESERQTLKAFVERRPA
jgi:hypothetical protein